jgi:peptide/nickel transport system permease protein
MTSYLLQRLFGAFLVLLIKSFVIFALIGLMPGDPIDLLANANPEATAQDIAKLREIYGVDQPITSRYVAWLKGIGEGDFGFSRISHRPVAEVVMPALANTLILTASAFVLSTIIAIFLGTIAALKRGTWIERSINLVAFAGISVPGFWLGLLLIYIFAVKFGVLPAGGMPAPDGPYSAIAYFILPLVTLVIVEIGGPTRYARSAMLEVLNQDFIRTAHAKGLTSSRVMWVHAFRNAMIPVTTIVALGFGHLFSGATLIETIFGWRGMGRLVYEAIMGNDYNLALVCLMMTTALILVANFLADLAYTFLDPRISLVGERKQ